MNPWRLVASGFGAGYAPRAPGTAGSVVGLVLGACLLSVGHLPLLFACVAVAGLGVYAISTVPEAVADPGWIVIDEIAGQMIVLLGLARVSLVGLVLAFALFRLLDIFKPGPVGWVDARHDAYGVMGDDIVAGGMALVILLIMSAMVTL